MASDAIPIKTEEGDNPPDVAEPVDEVEEDDAGDLEFYDKEADPNSEKLWLARVPKYVWQSWHKMTENLGMDDEVQIGTLRTWTEHAPDGTDKTHLRMLLNKDIPEHQLLPKEYDLEVTDREVKNHYVFSEKDTEKYRDQNKLRKAMQDQMIPMSARQPKTEANKVEKPRRFDRRSRFQPFYRKAVPKKTRIHGRVLYDLRCEPRDKEEETRLLAQHLMEADAKSGIKVISRNKASAITNPGAALSSNWGNNFIKSTAAPKPKKGETVKNARIPKNVLLDMLFECFREYQYWSMKALRQRTHQPDAWLRQVVEEICVLQKTGTFANHYMLSEAYRDRGGNQAKEGAAAEAVDDGDGDDDDEEMEDVLPS